MADGTAKTGEQRVHERIDDLQNRVVRLEAMLEVSERNVDRRVAALEGLPAHIADIKSSLATITARLDGHQGSTRTWQGWGERILLLLLGAVVAAGFELFKR